jgi:type IV pilus assembly protein PilW
MSRARRREAGFTLIEVLIAALIMVIIVAGVVMAANVQGHASATGARQRLAQAQGRSGSLFLERKLALAGYGIDPVFAFDFGQYVGPCPAGMGSCARDAVANSDELVFYARNPSYWVPGEGNNASPSGNAWNIRSVTAQSVTIAARAGDSFPAGQVVLEVCRGGNFYAFATVASNVGPAAGPGDLVVPLKSAVVGDPFNRPDLTVAPANNAACFAQGNARLFLVDRYRFHVRPVTLGGNVVPYLMLDQGIDRNRDGTIDENDELAIAEGIENLQVAYELAGPALPTPVVGIAAPITFVAAATGATGTSNTITKTQFPVGVPQPDQSVYGPSSFYNFAVGPPLSAQRSTDHQANIVAVRTALVSRSPGTDGSSLGDRFQPFNQTGEPSWITDRMVNGRDGYQRAMFESTVRLPNMQSGGMPYF